MGSSLAQDALFLVHEMSAAVLRPAAFVGLGAKRLFLTVADRLDAAGAHAGGDQGPLHCIGAAIAQSQVVLGRSTLVAVALHREVDADMLPEELGIALNGGLLIRTNRIRVVVEVDVLHALCEKLFFGSRRLRRRWRRRRIDRHARSRLLRSTRALRHQMI